MGTSPDVVGARAVEFIWMSSLSMLAKMFAFTDLSIKTLLVGLLNLDFKAFVLCNLIRMELTN